VAFDDGKNRPEKRNAVNPALNDVVQVIAALS
jgi:hypothetical protein